MGKRKRKKSSRLRELCSREAASRCYCCIVEQSCRRIINSKSNVDNESLKTGVWSNSMVYCGCDCRVDNAGNNQNIGAFRRIQASVKPKPNLGHGLASATSLSVRVTRLFHTCVLFLYALAGGCSCLTKSVTVHEDETMSKVCEGHFCRLAEVFRSLDAKLGGAQEEQYHQSILGSLLWPYSRKRLHGIN